MTDKYLLPLYTGENTKLEFKCCWCGKKEIVMHKDSIEWKEKQHGKHNKGTELEDLIE